MTLKKLAMPVLALLALCAVCGCPTSPPAAPVARSDEALVATSTQTDPSQIVTRIIYVDGMTWAVGWGGPTLQALEGLDGIKRATLKFDQGLFEVDFDSAIITIERIFEVITAKGYTPSLEAPEQPANEAAPITEDQRASLDIRTISHGEKIKVEDHLVAGRFTIIDYYADWCGPCLLLGHQIERLLVERGDVALRKVDIISWDTEAAAQIKALNVKGIPYVRIYGPNGDFLGAVNGNSINEIRLLVAGDSNRARDE